MSTSQAPKVLTKTVNKQNVLAEFFSWRVRSRQSDLIDLENFQTAGHFQFIINNKNITEHLKGCLFNTVHTKLGQDLGVKTLYTKDNVKDAIRTLALFRSIKERYLANELTEEQKTYINITTGTPMKQLEWNIQPVSQLVVEGENEL